MKQGHRHRLTVSSHRGQETFNVPVIRFRNSPAYVQRIIDQILRPFRHFCRAYIDNIVIFSSTFDEHIQYLRQVFATLDKINIHLSPKKSFLGYLSVRLLSQRVDALGLATSSEKLATISNLAFPRTLSQLERYLGITGYLRQYIPHYAAIIKPLQLRKTLLGKSINVRGNARKKVAGRLQVSIPTPRELNAFYQLQKLFASPSILHHFDEKRQLYIDLDASKEFGFSAHIYHSSEDTIPVGSKAASISTTRVDFPKQKLQQPILFLSRLLTEVETRY